MSARRIPDRDYTPHEVLLVRAGHHVWRLYKAEKPENGGYPTESGPLWEALQSIWDAKRKYRVVLKAQLAVKAAALNKRFHKKEPI